MNPSAKPLPSILRSPLVYLPLGMSTAALLVVLAHIALRGAAHEADEGATAHIWQLLIVGQVPFFIVLAGRMFRGHQQQWLPAIAVLSLALLAAITPVAVLGL